MRFLPATDRAGRFSFFKALAWLIGLAPAAWLIWTARAEGFGPKPVTFVLHTLGDAAVWLLIATLAITPLRTILRVNALIFARRIVGNFALAHALAHVGLFAWSEGPAKAASEVFLRVYLAIGLAALAMLIALGATSNDLAKRRLGAEGWRRLHRLIHAAAALALLHYFLQTKNDVTASLLPAGLFTLLMLWRGLDAMKLGAHPLALLALGLVAGVATAGIEAAWYFWRSGLPPFDVMAQNLDIEDTLRPPLIVAGVPVDFAAISFFLRRRGRARHP
jgi:sulfoxide reductase heme-binding subunit YedZ